MALREKVIQCILNNHPIPEGLQNPRYAFYYNDYKDNLYCSMSERTLASYEKGNGGETKSQTIQRYGRTYTIPAKMSSIVSSSAMTFNLLGNEPVTVINDKILPCGVYDVEFEKRMHTLTCGNKPAHLDAFLSDSQNKTAIFCEMKVLEWLGKPSKIRASYFSDKYYFKADLDAVPFPENAFEFFVKWANVLECISFKRYDAWQMFRHLLSIYNYTSFFTKNSVNKFDHNKSMAGKYNRIILANVINEFPASLIYDEEIRDQYEQALCEERVEARIFIYTMKHCEIPWLFDNNCNSGIEIKYLSAKSFADAIDMTDAKRDYLRRYYS